MEQLRLLYRDYDRTPYLYTLRDRARARGVDLVLTKAELGGRFAEFLFEGETDLLGENYWGLQVLRAEGAPIVSLATAVSMLNETLFVAPDVTTVSDLAGRPFAIRGEGPSQLIARLWLGDKVKGAEPIVYSEKEVGRWGQWRKVLDGTCAGTFVTNFHARDAAEAGLKALALPPYGFIGNVTLSTTEAIASDRGDALRALVAAAFDTHEMFRTDLAGVIEICRGEPRRLMEIESEAELARIVGIVGAELSPDPAPRAGGIVNTWRMRLARDPGLAAFNPMIMWDLSFAREVLRAGGSP